MIKVAIQRSFDIPLLRQTVGSKGKWGNCLFEIVDEVPANSFDWFVAFNYPVKDYCLDVPLERTILISMEPPIDRYSWYKDYFRYFGSVLTQFEQFDPNVIRHQPLLPWIVNRSYDELRAGIDDATFYNDRIDDKLVCITSNKVSHEGHKLRLNFIDQLSREVEIDIYGRGFQEIDDKFELFKQYKYALVIENSNNDYYWSEKITDALLSGCLPFYYGCPNIEGDLNHAPFIRLEMNNVSDAVKTIRSSMENNIYSSFTNKITESRKQLVDELQFFPVISAFIEERHPKVANHNANHFIPGHQFNHKPTFIDKLKFISRKIFK